MRHIWGMTYYRPPFDILGGRVPLSPTGFMPLNPSDRLASCLTSVPLQ